MKTRTELMVMLTCNDVTVPNAYELFDSAKDLPVFDWGFKSANISDDEVVRLIKYMKENGKTTFYEVIERNKPAYQRGERLAGLAGFDCGMGMKYDADLHATLKSLGIKFCPTLGKPGCVYNGQHGVLMGTPDEIVDEGKYLLSEKGVDGITIPVFRYYQDSHALLARILKEFPDTPIFIAGSVDSFEKIDMMFDLGIAKFTMGSALINRKYNPDGDFRANLEIVANYIEQKYPRG